MRVISLILLYLVFMDLESLNGQCPNRDSIYSRIVFLRGSTTVKYPDQLKELLLYEKQIRICPHYQDSVYTFLLLSIGVTCYRLGDFVSAAQYTRQALEIIQRNAGDLSINRAYLNRYYYYLSIYYDSLKMPSRKSEAIDSCISNELRTNSDYHYALIVLEDHVRDLYEKGDYNLCVERSTLGEALIHKYYIYSDSLNHIIFFLYYRANALRALKKFNEEEQLLQTKQAFLLKLKDKDYVGVLYSLFGYMYAAKREYETAIVYFERAFSYDRFTERKEISAEVLNEIGKIYAEKLNQNNRALPYYRKALSVARHKTVKNASVSDSLYILGNMANVYVQKELFDYAFFLFQEAFDKIRKGMDESGLIQDVENYVNANTAETVIQLVLDKGNAYLRLYYFNKNPQSLIRALSIYKTADRLLTKIKEGQAEIQSKLFWQKDTHSLYEHAIAVSYLLNHFDDAFYFFEKSRAVLLSEQLNQQNKMADASLLKQAELKKSILQRERDLEKVDNSSVQYINIQKELVLSKQSLEGLEQSMKKDVPLYYQTALDTQFVTVKAVQKYLYKDNRQLLEIFSGDSAVYALFINRDQIYFSQINKNEFDSLSLLYISFISNSALLNRQYEQFIKTAARLYEVIFRNSPITMGRIIISPDVQIFPFESLVTNNNISSPVYFLNDHAVSYTYSARYLLIDFKTGVSGTGGGFLGVAPVQYHSGVPMADLQGSDISLNKIGTYFSDAQNLISVQATRHKFQQQFSSYKIVQVYAHASDSSSRGEPVIYLADSALYLSDLIPESKPLSRLIVLSACETGTGKLYQGEGVFSFNRGFASLGIPSSITNLWSVDNQSTYRITEMFYKYLSAGLPIDVALQKAKLNFIKSASGEKKLPYFWAAAILAGRSDAIPEKIQFPWKDFLLVSGLTALSFFVWQGRKNKKNKFQTGLGADQGKQRNLYRGT